MEPQTRAAKLSTALPHVFAVPPRETKPELNRQLSRLVHLGAETAGKNKFVPSVFCDSY